LYLVAHVMVKDLRGRRICCCGKTRAHVMECGGWRSEWPFGIGRSDINDRGVWCGVVSDAATAAATREKEGIKAEASVFPDTLTMRRRSW
jgi:hypothetical protein